MKLFHAGLLSLSALVLPLAAHAAPVCPALTGASGAYTTAIPAAGTNCNTIITVNPDGTLSLAFPNIHPYDGSDDNYVGVVNNSSTSVGGLALAGSGIFGFDGDGIDGFGIVGNATDLAAGPSLGGYGGSDAYFSITNGNTGTVLFLGGIAAGATGYFSLENAPNTGTITGKVIPGVTPEPSSLILLGTGVLGMAGAVRRRLGANR